MTHVFASCSCRYRQNALRRSARTARAGRAERLGSIASSPTGRSRGLRQKAVSSPAISSVTQGGRAGRTVEEPTRAASGRARSSTL
ncbi:unnamed protein product [Ectocarpus sp. 8 AP-2014]